MSQYTSTGYGTPSASTAKISNPEKDNWAYFSNLILFGVEIVRDTGKGAKALQTERALARVNVRILTGDLKADDDDAPEDYDNINHQMFLILVQFLDQTS